MEIYFVLVIWYHDTWILFTSTRTKCFVCSSKWCDAYCSVQAALYEWPGCGQRGWCTRFKTNLFYHIILYDTRVGQNQNNTRKTWQKKHEDEMVQKNRAPFLRRYSYTKYIPVDMMRANTDKSYMFEKDVRRKMQMSRVTRVTLNRSVYTSQVHVTSCCPWHRRLGQGGGEVHRKRTSLVCLDRTGQIKIRTLSPFSR